MRWLRCRPLAEAWARMAGPFETSPAITVVVIATRKSLASVCVTSARASKIGWAFVPVGLAGKGSATPVVIASGIRTAALFGTCGTANHRRFTAARAAPSGEWNANAIAVVVIIAFAQCLHANTTRPSGAGRDADFETVRPALRALGTRLLRGWFIAFAVVDTTLAGTDRARSGRPGLAAVEFAIAAAEIFDSTDAEELRVARTRRIPGLDESLTASFDHFGIRTTVKDRGVQRGFFLMTAAASNCANYG